MYIAMNLVADREFVAVADTQEAAVKAVSDALDKDGALGCERSIISGPISKGRAVPTEYLRPVAKGG